MGSSEAEARQAGPSSVWVWVELTWLLGQAGFRLPSLKIFWAGYGQPLACPVARTNFVFVFYIDFTYNHLHQFDGESIYLFNT